MVETWGFYGRSAEIDELRAIVDSGRWFFCSISGRRRIGKTSLIRAALHGVARNRRVFYMQVPDSDERGVVQAFREAIEDVGVAPEEARKIRTLSDMARQIGAWCKRDVIIVLDEFQYFHRQALSSFTSFLQAQVDALRDTAVGGLFVLGSIHTEMTAILEDRYSPLFNRVTHRIQVGHWDFATLFEVFRRHQITTPVHQLFLWAMFEGVPKFYRDCFERGVLTERPSHRHETLIRLFFDGSSPLRDEAENWFLRELRGRYDTILKMLATQGPCSHGDLTREYAGASESGEKQLGGYLKVLSEKYRIVDKQLPIFSRKGERKTRYLITDNFLSAWLAVIGRQVERSRVLPVEDAVRRADVGLQAVEGFAFEKLIHEIHEECSRKAVGDFPLSDRIKGYWNKPDGSDIEIDLVAINDGARIVRFGSCKRSASAHDSTALAAFQSHVGRFLATGEGRRFTGWQQQMVLFSPEFDSGQRQRLESSGYICRDLRDYDRWLGGGRLPNAA
ncbi:MAG: ATP-binding protein [Alphaproteobacteria bacterium]|nr:ATP-binding protein [Alphaproteobacteria bacterium]